MFIFSNIYLHIHDTYTITEMTVHDQTMFIHIYIYIRSALSPSSSSQLHQDMSAENQRLQAGLLVLHGIIVYLAEEILFSTIFSMLGDVV